MAQPHQPVIRVMVNIRSDTDLGRNTTFKLNKNSIDGIEGAKVSYSNKQYEIAIPASAIKQL